MSHNHLEQMVAEWYEYQGYFVKRNILVGKRPKGGYECELDVVAFHPETKHLIHIEPSLDTDSWAIREKRFQKKFDAGKKYIPSFFVGFDVGAIEQIALFLAASKQNHQTIGGGEIKLASELLIEIFQGIRAKNLMSSAIPEQFPILRTFQYVSEYHKLLFKDR